MALHSTSRLLSSLIFPRTSSYSTLQLNPATSAEKFYNLLQKNGGNIEKALGTMRSKLDSKCVDEVIHRCSFGPIQMGLRFFIWAGLQPNYRHSSFMYSRACKLFAIHRTPNLLFDVIDDYRTEGCPVDIKTFKVILNLCKEAKLANEALLVLRKMSDFNLCADTIAYNVVIKLFSDKGEMDKALELMKEMGLIDLYPDMITYIAMIRGFCDAERLEDARGLFKVMKSNGCFPNAVAYSVLLDGVSRYGSTKSAMALLEEMEKEGGNCSPNVITYTSVIQSLCRKGQFMEALKVLDKMEGFGCAPNRVTVSTLIDGFCSDGRLEEAYKLIDRVVAGGRVSYGDCYSSLVVSLVRIKKIVEAEELFHKMLNSGVKPDSVACSVVIRQLCLEGRVLKGFYLCDEIEKNGYLSSIDSDIYRLLLFGLCEQSHSAEAAELARLMLKKGIRLKPPYADSIREHLRKSEDKELCILMESKVN